MPEKRMKKSGVSRELLLFARRGSPELHTKPGTKVSHLHRITRRYTANTKKARRIKTA